MEATAHSGRFVFRNGDSSFGANWMRNDGFTYRDLVSAPADGQSVLSFYSTRYKHSSQSEWRERIAQSCVTINGRVAQVDAPIRRGDILEYHRPPWDEPDVPKELRPLFIDKDVALFDKPSGLPVLPGGGFLENTLLHIAREEIGKELSPVHRLGRGTSGAILFSRTREAASALSLQMRNHRIRKTYLAIVEGVPSEMEFVIRRPIGSVAHPLLGSVFAASSHGKYSESIGKVLRYDEERNQSLVEAMITTGRPHQIRIHLASIGHPLAGDPLYAKGGLPKDRTADDERPALPGDCGYILHSWKLGFHHPRDNQWIEVTCPLPAPLTESFPEM